MSAKLEIATAPAPMGPSDLALLTILSAVAGLVDVTGFLSLGHVFTAHITGNLVAMAAQIVDGGPPHVAQLLSITVFGLAVAAAYFLARRASIGGGRGGLLVGQSLLLLVLGLVVRSRHGDVLPLTDSGDRERGQHRHRTHGSRLAWALDPRRSGEEAKEYVATRRWLFHGLRNGRDERCASGSFGLESSCAALAHRDSGRRGCSSDSRYATRIAGLA